MTLNRTPSSNLQNIIFPSVTKQVCFAVVMHLVHIQKVCLNPDKGEEMLINSVIILSTSTTILKYHILPSHSLFSTHIHSPTPYDIICYLSNNL